MQVSVETLNALERRVTVRVPAEKVATEMQGRLQTLSRKVKIDGFRPGKVPLKVVRQLYGQQARFETASELMEQSLTEALTQENLNPLSQPHIEPQRLEEGQDFEYSATFEVMPDIEPTGFETIRVDRPVAEVTEQDIDNMVQTLRWQHVVWNPAERPVRQDDQVCIDFTGQIEGQDFPGNKGENAKFVLNGKSLLRDFEERLIGLSSGAETEFDCVFPEDYHQHLAGKTAHFQIKLHAVEEATLPEVDDAFAEKLDIHGGVANLRESLRGTLQRGLRENARAFIKRQVMRGLLMANQIPLPRALIANEIENLASQMQFPKDLADEQAWQLKLSMFGPHAYQRVALGLLMAELVKRESIQIDAQRVRSVLESLTAEYQDPGEVIASYEQNPQMMEQVQALALEEQVVDWLLERAQVTEKPMTFDEVMHPKPPANPEELPGEPSVPDAAAQAALESPHE